MSTIDLHDLKSTGLDLFLDSENYLNELTGDELTIIHGGSTTVCSAVVVTRVSQMLTKSGKVCIEFAAGISGAVVGFTETLWG